MVGDRHPVARRSTPPHVASFPAETALEVANRRAAVEIGRETRRSREVRADVE